MVDRPGTSFGRGALCVGLFRTHSRPVLLLLLTGLLGIATRNKRAEADGGFPLFLGAVHPKSLNLFSLFPELSASLGATPRRNARCTNHERKHALAISFQGSCLASSFLFKLF